MVVRCRASGCGRELTSPISRRVGYGPVCARRLGLRVVVVAVPRRPAVRRSVVMDGQLVLDLDEAELPLRV